MPWPRKAGPVALPRSVPRPGTLRCADLLFIEGQASSAPSDDGASLEMQAARVIERLHEALEANRAKPADVVRLNVYYVTDGRPDDLMSLGSACASGFEAPGPVITFVPLPALGARHRKVEIDAIAMPGRDGKAPPRHELPAEPPWRWPSDWPFSQALRCGDAIFIGGQPAFDPERRILNAGDMVAQTHCVMDRIVEMLAAFDATYDDVMKVGCWYNGGASTETLWRNALVRTSYMTKPGATSTGVPLEVMFHPDLEIQVDIVAMKTS